VVSLQNSWRRLTNAFWFLPFTLTAGLLVLAVGLVELDRSAGDHGIDAAYGGGAAAARSILSSLAGSLITVAGLTFSIVIVTLQLASSQYSPRIMRTFLGDRLTQILAGAFVGVFGYTLIVLRSVRGGSEGLRTAIPSLAVTVAIVLGIAALGLLIVFVHHISRMIQVSTITARLGAETLEAVDMLAPAGSDPAQSDSGGSLDDWRRDGAPGAIRAGRAGFVDAVTPQALGKRAESLHLRVHLPVTSGAFVTRETVIAEVWPAGGADALASTVADAVTIADERDLRQDALFGVRQLADIALRALSPGVNDPTTARTCLGYLQAVLEEIAAQPPADRKRSVGSVVMQQQPFRAYLDVALTEVAQAAAGQPLVGPCVLDTIAAVRAAAFRHGQIENATECEEAAAAVGSLLLDAAPSERDRSRVCEALERATGGPVNAISPV
jgi:uncharacterized membrane protein